MHLIQMTGEILNSSLNNPDIDWLPEQWEDSVNSVLDNAYTYGRSAISDGVRYMYIFIIAKYISIITYNIWRR